MIVDEIDLKILSALLRNSRTPYRKLAKELDIGESTVYTRINKLIDSGILKSFTVDIDLRRLGLTTEVIVEIKPYPQYLNKVKKALTSINEVIEILLIGGDYPIHVRVAAKDNQELSHIIDNIATVEGVMDFKIRYVFEKVLSRSESSIISELLA
jgi:DNA-binding Lrp family transcriptional regulator